MGRDRQLAVDGGADRSGDDGDHLPAPAVPRHRGGKHRAPGPAPGQMGIPGLPGPGRAVRGAHCPGRADALAQQRVAGLLRHQPAPGPGPSGPGPAGLHRRCVGGHRHGDRRQRGAVDHGLQRHAAALAAAAQQCRAPVRSVPSLDALGTPGEHRRHPAAGLCQLPPARFHREPGHHRPDRLRRRDPAGASHGRRAVLETGQPPWRVRRPGRRHLHLVLHPGIAAGGP